MTGISGEVTGDIKLEQIAYLLGNLYIGNNNKIEIAQVAGCLVLPDGAKVQFTDEQLQFISARMEAIRNIPLPLAKLQQRLIENYKNDHWYLKRLFDGAKTSIKNSYISLSIITAEEYQKKQKQLENLDAAQDPLATEIFTIDERVPSHEDLFLHKEPIALSDLFKKQPHEIEAPKRLIVFGRAGIGKSVLCQYLAIRWYQEVAGSFRKLIVDNQSEEIKPSAEKEQLDWLKEFKVVFWIRLREIPDLLKDPQNDGSLENIINVCCYNGKEEQKRLRSSLEQYKQESLFILDGYDEIEDSFDVNRFFRAYTLHTAWNILKEQPNIILTSRPTNNLNSLWFPDKAVRKLEVMGFSNEQVKKYAQNFITESPNKERRSPSVLLEYLRSKPSIWGIAHIPINLEMLCWLYCQNKLSEKAKNLSMLYQEIIEEVVFKMSKTHKTLNEWLEIPIAGIEKGISYVSKKIGLQFLAHLAYQGMLKNELLLSSETIELSAKALLGVHKIYYDKRVTERLLEISHQLGFLFSTSQGGQSVADQTHYFIHLSFQEHFAARYVASCLTETEETKEKYELMRQLETDKYSPRYQLMWWLTAGLLAHKGKTENNYDILKVFSHHVFLGFLSQHYMSQINFELVVHCLDECLGVNHKILHEILNDSEWRNLSKKMREYFSYFVFYSNSSQKNIETLGRCLNFLSMKPFIDELFFQRFIDFAKNGSLHAYHRRQIWEILLRIPEYSAQAVAELIALAQYEGLETEGRQAWETLLRIPWGSAQAAAELIALAQDKSFEADGSVDERIEVWEILLRIPEYSAQAIAELLALAQDKSLETNQKIQAWEILLRIPEHSTQAIAELIALAQDKSLETNQKIQVWETLLKIPKYSVQAAAELIILVQDKRLELYEKSGIWETLLKIPEYSVHAAAELIVLAKNKNLDGWRKRYVLEILLKIPEYLVQAAAELIALGQDKSLKASERIEIWKILLRIPKYSAQAIAELIVLAQDKSLEAAKRIEIWEILLKIPEYSAQAAAGLIALVQDKSIEADERRQFWSEQKSIKAWERRLIWKILLKIPEYSAQAMAELIALAQDKNLETHKRRQVLKILLEIPGCLAKVTSELIALAQDKSLEVGERIEAWEILLEVPEYLAQAAAELIALAKNKGVGPWERKQVWEILSKIPDHSAQAVAELIALAKNKNIGAWARRPALETLLEIPEYSAQAVAELVALAQDKSLEAKERRKAWKILLKIPQHSVQATAELIALAEDKSLLLFERIKIWKILLKIPQYSVQAVAELIVLAEDESIWVFERIEIWKTLLKIPKYSAQAAAELIALAQDKTLKTYERSEIWETLLAISEHSAQSAVELIALAQDKTLKTYERSEIWETLLAIPEHSAQAVVELIALAQDKTLETYEKKKIWSWQQKSLTPWERRLVWEVLLKIPEYSAQATAELTALAQDKSLEVDKRIQAWEILLKIPVRSAQAVAELIALAQDKSLEADERRQAWEILLEISDHSAQAAAELIALAQDKSLETDERRQILETLLEIPEHSAQAVAELITLAQDKSLKADERIEVLEILLKIPEHAKKADELIALAEDESIDIKSPEKNGTPKPHVNPLFITHLDSRNFPEQKGSPILTQFNKPAKNLIESKLLINVRKKHRGRKRCLKLLKSRPYYEYY